MSVSVRRSVGQCEAECRSGESRSVSLVESQSVSRYECQNIRLSMLERQSVGVLECGVSVSPFVGDMSVGLSRWVLECRSVGEAECRQRNRLDCSKQRTT